VSFVVAHNGARVWGGAERATTLVLKGLQARGHRVLLLCGDPLVRARAAELGVPAELLPLGGDVALHHALRMAWRLRRARPDALIVGTFKKMWLAGLAGRLAGVPRVVARIGLETDVPRSAKYRMVLRRWIHHVVVNAAGIAPAYAALPGWSDARVTVIHNGVHLPPRTDTPGGVRRALGIPAAAPVVGAVARLSRQKRFDRLLEAMAALPGDVHCVLAGDGPRRERLQARAAELGLADRVHFLGHRGDTHDVLDALDVYVVSSDTEGMSNAMLEALAAGVPVVSTPVSGAAEALDAAPGGDAPGVVLPDFEAATLAAALRDLAGDAGRRMRMAEAARARHRERFSFEGMIDTWERVLGVGA
jgi:glycosyltransferase involved in cell wall biosynthesis